MVHRLLYLIGELRPGGSERQLYYLLKSLDRRSFQPEVAVWSFRETDPYVSKIRELDVRIHALPVNGRRSDKLRELRRTVKRFKPEIIHSYSTYINFAAFVAALGTNSLAIGGVRSDFEWAQKEAGAIVGRLSGRWPRHQIVNSVATAEVAQQSRSVFSPKRCMVVRNGVDLDSFRRVPSVVAGTAHILCIGSLFPIKRWDRVIAAAVNLRNKGLKFVITVVGDGPLRAPLTNQAELKGVAECVKFIGHEADIASQLSKATFLLHTADKEGCPNAVMEAMASGRAVVATDAGDVARLVADGETGFVVPREDEALLVERLATLIVDPELCCRMGRAGRTKAEREFGLTRMVSETLSVYKALGWKGVMSNVA